MVTKSLAAEHKYLTEVPIPGGLRLSSTYEGMAHFAGTGPIGKTCAECGFYKLWKGEKPPKVDAEPIRRVCLEFQRMTHRRSTLTVPSNVPACKYFSERPE